GWVTGLHRADRFPWTLRCALGFAWSMALVGLVGGPFLWFQGSFADFLAVLYPVWAVWTVVGLTALFLSWRAGPAAEGLPDPPLPAPAPPAEVPWPVRMRVLAHLFVYGLVAMAVGCTWALGGSLARRVVVYSTPVLLVVGYLAARHLRRTAGPLLGFTP